VAPAQISISCSHCGAVYQFAPSAIPAEGYDARCTQCQSVFFVSAQPVAPAPIPLAAPAAAAPAAAPAAAAPVDLGAPKAPAAAEDPGVPMDLGFPKEDPATAGPEPIALGSSTAPANPGPSPQMEAAPSAAAPIDDDGLGPDDPYDSDVGHDAHDLMVLAGELGEPAEAPDGASVEDDFQSIMRRKRKRLMVAGGVIAAIPTLVILLYFVLPGVFDQTVGPIVGIKARIHPDAIPLYDAGVTLMLQDTSTGYTKAIAKFEAALVVDSRYPDALAMAGLAYTFRGQDIRNRGASIRGDAEKIITEIKQIQEVKKRPKDAEAQVNKLRTEVAALGKKAGGLYEEGGKDFAKAGEFIKRGLAEFSTSPLMVEASGIYLIVQDAERAGDARKRMEIGLEMRGAGPKIDLANPPDFWLPYLQANLDASHPKTLPKAIPYFEAAVKKEPRFQRGRFDLARTLDAAGKPDEAKKVVQKIIGAVPAHEKAKELLGHLTAPATPSPDPGPAPARPGKAKKRKKR
jgi:predicted Zn finger-like uncharacterized protein